MYGVDRKRLSNGISSILAECLERKFISSNGDSHAIHLVIPYNQLDISEMHVLTENMFLLTVSLHRCLQSTTGLGTLGTAGSNNKIPSVVKREIHCDLLVGPCIANDLYALLHNRITLCMHRSTLSSYVSVDKKATDDIEAFEHIANDLQEEIYDTMLQIEKFHPMSSHIDNFILHKTAEQSIILPFKLLYLKKAALKIYLWFLIGNK